MIKRRAENKQRWLCFKGFSHDQFIPNLGPLRQTYAEVSFWLIVIALSAYIRPGYATVYVPNIEQALLSGFCLPFIFGALAAWFSQKI